MERSAGQAVDERIAITIDLTVVAEPSKWRAASTAVGSVPTPRGDRAWWRRAPAPQPIPRGRIHAYGVGDDVTACSMSLTDLHPWDDQPFSDRLLNRCPDCLRRSSAG